MSDLLSRLRARLLALHAAGTPTATIARRLGLHRATAYRWLKAIGLRSADTTDNRSRRSAKIYHAKLCKRGRHIGQIHHERERARCAELGWFPIDSTKQADVLDVIEAVGPCTSDEIASRLGLPLSTAQHRLLSLKRSGWLLPVRTGSRMGTQVRYVLARKRRGRWEGDPKVYRPCPNGAREVKVRRVVAQ